MSRSSSPLVIGDGDLIIEEVPVDEDEAVVAMPPPPPNGPIGPTGPPNACIIRLDSAEPAAESPPSWPRNPAHFPPPSSSRD